MERTVVEPEPEVRMSLLPPLLRALCMLCALSFTGRSLPCASHNGGVNNELVHGMQWTLRPA
jgi:hypothetical protein